MNIMRAKSQLLRIGSVAAHAPDMPVLLIDDKASISGRLGFILICLKGGETLGVGAIRIHAPDIPKTVCRVGIKDLFIRGPCYGYPPR